MQKGSFPFWDCIVHVFVYEFITGGGTFGDSSMEVPHGSLKREGAAMVSAVSRDLVQASGMQVTILRDSRLTDFALPGCRVLDVRSADEETELISRAARDADKTVLIAPEFDGNLLERCCHVQEMGGVLLGPGPSFVELTSDKHRTVERLGQAGIPVPPGVCLSEGAGLPIDFSYPAVVKPIDGAGSQGLKLVCSAGEMSSFRASGPMRLEQFCSGFPASVSFLCGPRSRVALPPCRQQLTDDGEFAYLGGQLPLSTALADRAKRLASAAMDALPEAQGYVGVDVVLGENGSGGDDRVIEVNPRLTTSYVGLTELAEGNLAESMIRIAEGHSVEISFHDGPVRFQADGCIV